MSPFAAPPVKSSGWRCQNLFDRPAKLKVSTTQCSVVNASGLSPCHNTLGYALERPVDGSASVKCLCTFWNPCAVRFGIRRVIVNTFNGVLGGWSWTHVSEKILERGPVYGNASGAVILKTWRVRIPTSIQHTMPNTIFRCAIQRRFTLTCFPNFIKPTSTTFCVPSTQVLSIKRLACSAGTFTFPIGMRSMIIRITTQHCESTKRFSGEIDKLTIHVMPPRWQKVSGAL